MISTKKNIAPLALITLLFFPALVFLYLQTRQKIVQHQMLEKLEHAELQKITLHNSDVHWYKKGKEIILNSALFDVHRFSIKNDSTFFTGLFDTEETELKKQVKKLMEKEDQKSSAKGLLLAKLLMQLWIDDGRKDYQFMQSDFINSKDFIVSYNVLSAEISIPFPPPKA